MKKQHYLLPFLAVSAVAQADDVDLASADQYQMQLNFGPPLMITPQTDLTAPVENQFDYQRPWVNPSVAQNVSNNDKLLQINTQFSGYSNLQRALFRHRDSNYYVIAQAFRMELDDYKDGDGNKVDAGYTRNGQLLMFGYLPTQWQEYRIGFVHDRLDNDKQPQHGMDSPYTRRIVLTGMARLGQQDQSNTLNLNVRHISLDRRANNFENRTASGTKAQMLVERDMLNLSADYRYKYGNHTSQFGVKYDSDTHTAARYVMLANGTLMRNAYRFPDIHSKHWHIFYDHIWQLNEKNKLRAGMSYDHLTAEAQLRNIGAAVGTNTFASPNQAWRMHYGSTVDGKQRTHGAGFALKYEFKPSEQQVYHLNFDSLIRQPHNAERYTALIGNNGAGWLGNPFLKPERHNRVTAEAKWQGEGWRDYGKVKDGDVSGSWQIALKADYDKVKNFITLDRARGQAGVVATNGNVISRNVDAALIGAELSLAKNLTNNLSARAKVRYQYGDNDTDNRPLYNVRPLSIDSAIDWRDYTSFGSYNLGVSVHYSHKSSRLDDDASTGFGRDVVEHFRSYTVVNLYGGVQFQERFAVTAGIDNLFNRQYYAFNEQNHVAALTPYAVAAPERTYWIGLNFNF